MSVSTVTFPAHSSSITARGDVRSKQAHKASGITAIGGVLMLAAGAVGLSGSIQKSDSLAQAPSTQAVAAAIATPPAKPLAERVAPSIAFATPAQPALGFHNSYYEQLRSRMQWKDVKMGENVLKTPTPDSRLLLAQSAAERAALHEVGLNFRDVYGIINAETSWIPRMGASKNGTPNLGIAQFEPATAKALGLQDPHDPVEAVHVAALHLKTAAQWSAKRLAKLKLNEEQRAAKLREGISIYYNLSTKGRNVWNGLNTAKLPIETQRHISNARRGAREAETLAQQLAAVKKMTQGVGTMTAAIAGSGS